MKRTLYLKFILVYLLFGLLSFLAISTIISDMLMKHIIKQNASDLYEEANLIASRYAFSLYNSQVSYDDVQAQLEAIDTYLSAQVWIIDANGTVTLNSRTPVDSDTPTVIEHFDPTVTTGGHCYQTSDFYGMFNTEMLSVFYPVTSNFKVRGYVVIHTPLAQITASRDQMLNYSYITLALVFGLSLLVLLAFTYFIYLPLMKITKAANEYAKGNLKYELPVYTDDEIGYLAASMNLMSTELYKMEDYQRKFVANISHDFRSPLTSIKGYLEAILDGTIPFEMQEKYLNIVLFETERLNKLTQSLLTLNDFDSKGTLLERSNFDINKIIKKIAASFEGTCTAKKISIELVLTGKSLYVNADMGKIQQVLYNLIDNAIKFTHHNSIIKIETTEKNEKIFVSVKDSGIGIPKESLKLIWDRFYKTDLSRGKDKKGTGLGLSIVKEIIQHHNENIDVISTEGVGTEFVFTLSKSKENHDDEKE